MERITQSDLECLVDRINKATGSPAKPYTKTDTSFFPNALNYHLDWAYGGVCLVRMCKTGSGTTSISQIGFAPKRALYQWMGAFLAGLAI